VPLKLLGCDGVDEDAKVEGFDLTDLEPEESKNVRDELQRRLDLKSREK
jgi:hypothetical protein